MAFSASPESLKKFTLTGLLMILTWFLSQNIFVEMVVYQGQLSGKVISWAPLTPFGPWFNPTLIRVGSSECTLQGQMPWLLMSFIFYWVLLNERSKEKEKIK